MILVLFVYMFYFIVHVLLVKRRVSYVFRVTLRYVFLRNGTLTIKASEGYSAKNVVEFSYDEGEFICERRLKFHNSLCVLK